MIGLPRNETTAGEYRFLEQRGDAVEERVLTRDITR